MFQNQFLYGYKEVKLTPFIHEFVYWSSDDGNLSCKYFEYCVPFMELLKQLCSIHATAGNEIAMKEFIVDFAKAPKTNWKVHPKIHQGPDLQDNLILEFGKPRTAVFAHMDSVGYTVGYYDQLIPIGSPQAPPGTVLRGQDHLGPISCSLVVDPHELIKYQFGRAIARGTDLVYQCNFIESNQNIQSCYLDNRLGIYNLLMLATDLEHGLLVFSCREEHGGGAVPILTRYIYDNFGITQALISDVTWVTSGIKHGQGVAVSLRDQGIPRKSYLQGILDLAESSGVKFQLEVESHGSSDARELQASPYAMDWCFIGAPISHAHSPDEKVHKLDILSMTDLYRYLLVYM